jgi:type II secretory pathway component PulF
VTGAVLLLAGLAVAAFTLPRPYWLRRVVYLVPIAGPLWRASGLVEFSQLMGILLAEGVPLPEALRLAADGVSDPSLAAAARRAADAVESGLPLAEGMEGHWPFPATLVAMTRWGEQTSDLAGTLLAAGEMYDGRVRIQSTLLEGLIPVAAFTVIAVGVGLLMLGMMLPLVGLIQYLT